jgi:hypothetical protein
MTQEMVLQGVPRIGFGIHLCPFLGTLYAYRKHVGDPQDYQFLMGIAGTAFHRLWNCSDGGNVGILRYENELFRLAFAVLDYEWRPSLPMPTRRR